jgi:eukaryotic-like serine/threonine-protein kinase
VVLAVGAWLSVPWTNPERSIERIESGLARGAKQTLIGETGSPAWYRHAVGSKVSRVSTRQSGEFTFHAWSLAVLELVRDPQKDSYRLRAEVRHDETGQGSEVGICLGYRAYPSTQGTIHSFVQLSFDDIDDAREIFDRVKMLFPKQKPPKGNPVRLTRHLYVEGDRSPTREHGMGGPVQAFKPGGQGNTDWRNIVVEVRPRGIRASWEGALLGEWSSQEMAKALRDIQNGLRRKDPNDPLATQVPDEFALRGAVGLYVRKGSGSFRRVVLEPLND